MDTVKLRLLFYYRKHLFWSKNQYFEMLYCMMYQLSKFDSSYALTSSLQIFFTMPGPSYIKPVYN